MLYQANWILNNHNTRSVQHLIFLIFIIQIIDHRSLSPSKYPPSPIHTLLQTVFPFHKTALEIFFLNVLQRLWQICLFMSRVLLTYRPFSTDLNFGITKKSHGTRSGSKEADCLSLKQKDYVEIKKMSVTLTFYRNYCVFFYLCWPTEVIKLSFRCRFYESNHQRTIRRHLVTGEVMTNPMLPTVRD